MQVQYPVTMTQQITLYHHLTQVHFQRFYEQASTRMASIQGLHANQDTDAEISKLEELFSKTLTDTLSTLQEREQGWAGRLEVAGIDPTLDAIQGGETFAAPLTTPWGHKLLKIYSVSDRVLMYVEMAWIAEEIDGVLDKRNATNEARAPLVACCRQIQRAVTQAFQESKRRDTHVAVPPAYGDAGHLIFRTDPEALEILKTTSAKDADSFNAMVTDLISKYEDEAMKAAIEEVRVIRLALVEQRAKRDAEKTEGTTSDDNDSANEAMDGESDTQQAADEAEEEAAGVEAADTADVDGDDDEFHPQSDEDAVED